MTVWYVIRRWRHMAGDSGSGNRVFVIGVGMTKFCKPGRRKNDDGSDWAYPDMAREAGTKALADAGIDYREVQEAYVGYVYGESTSGQRAVYELGMTGIPVVNVNNNCSTGSTALYLTAKAIRGGADCTWPWASRRCSPARWARCTRTARSRWTSTSWHSPRSARCSSRRRPGCSAPPGASTCASTARRSSTSPRSARRTTGTRSTTRTRSSRTPTRSTRFSTHG